MDFEMLPSLVEQDAQLCFVLKERAQKCTALGPDHRGVRARTLKPKHLAFMSPSLLQSFITLGKPLNCSTP